ncbi:MAG TPA: NAD(P)/FAD-dependent oxidoreductase [Kofleriaceae bacterium]|nr:NAD(P)/FAD-dependent oxidoreductase [Kofleriaceae bacterium]
MTYDAIIVGARCAGAPLARFLARAGKKVALVDSATFPSDQPMSTHFIHPYGMRVLEDLGLAERIRDISPPVNLMRQDVGGHIVEFRINPGGSCPRRIDLDQVLLDGAREAGAEVRLGERVIEIIREKSRVVGVVTASREATRHELRGNVVVGADGRHSTIGDLVEAERYFEYVGPRGAYWAYWPRPKFFDEAPYNGATMLRFVGEHFQFVFPTNRDQLILGVGFPREELATWKTDPHAKLLEHLRSTPFFKPLVEAQPISKTLGLTKAEYFFRRAAGPGWALVGDAGLFKDPTPGLGITDALRDAKNLAAAIIEGGDQALERYWRQRDVDSIELFNFARDMGELFYNNALTRMLFAKLETDPELGQRMVRVIEREISPYGAFKPSEVVRWTFGALLRGKLGVLPAFFRAGFRGAQVQKELKRRRALLVPALPASPVLAEKAA